MIQDGEPRSPSQPPTLASELALLAQKIAGLRVSELKELCKATGLAMNGRKLDLTVRLIQFCSSLFLYNKKIEILAMQTLVLKATLNSTLPALSHLVNAIKQGLISYEQVAQLVAQYQRISSALRGCAAADVALLLSTVDPIPFVPLPLTQHLHQQRNPRKMLPQTQLGPCPDSYAGPPVHFRNTLFYKQEHTVGQMQVLRVSKGRGYKQFTLRLSNTHIAFLKQPGSQHRLYLFSCIESTPDHQNALLQYPPIEIYVDGTLTKQNVRGIKGKPGTTRPADLTPYIMRPHRPVHVHIIYSDAAEQHLLTTALVAISTPESIMALVAGKPHVLQVSTQRAIAAENDRNIAEGIVMDNVSLSLRCPITYARISHPVKSIQCDHVQCFDGLSFLIMQERIPVWQCPVCSKTINENSLSVSDYLQDILDKTLEEVDTVLLNGDGSWTPMQEGDKPEPTAESEIPLETLKREAVPAQNTEESIEIISLDSHSEDEGQASAENRNIEETPTPEPAPAQIEAHAVENVTVLDTTMNDVLQTDPALLPPETATVLLGQSLSPTSAPEESQNLTEFSSDDELIVTSNRRKRARFLPEFESLIIPSASSASSTNIVVNENNGSEVPKRHEEMNNEARSESTDQDRRHPLSAAPEGTEYSASSLDDVPISQYLAQRISQLNSIPLTVEASIASKTAQGPQGTEPSNKDVPQNAVSMPEGAPAETAIIEHRGQVDDTPSIVQGGTTEKETVDEPVTAETHSTLTREEATDEGVSLAVEEQDSYGITSHTNAANQTDTDADNDIDNADVDQEPIVDASANVVTEFPASELQQTIESSASTKQSGPGSETSPSLPAQTHTAIQDGAYSPADETASQTEATADSTVDSAADFTTGPVSAGKRPASADTYLADKCTEWPPTSAHREIQVMTDSLIPAVWQNKENHPKGLERISCIREHPQLIIFKASSAPGLKPNSPLLVSPTQEEQVLQRISTEPIGGFSAGFLETRSYAERLQRKANHVPSSARTNELPYTQALSDSGHKNMAPRALDVLQAPKPAQNQAQAANRNTLFRPSNFHRHQQQHQQQQQHHSMRTAAWPTMGKFSLSRNQNSGNLASATASAFECAGEIYAQQADIHKNRSASQNSQTYLQSRQAFLNIQARNGGATHSPTFAHSGKTFSCATGNNPTSLSSLVGLESPVSPQQSAYQNVAYQNHPQSGSQGRMLNPTHQQNIRMSSDMIHAYHRSQSESMILENRLHNPSQKHSQNQSQNLRQNAGRHSLLDRNRANVSAPSVPQMSRHSSTNSPTLMPANVRPEHPNLQHLKNANIHLGAPRLSRSNPASPSINFRSHVASRSNTLNEYGSLSIPVRSETFGHRSPDTVQNQTNSSPQNHPQNTLPSTQHHTSADAGAGAKYGYARTTFDIFTEDSSSQATVKGILGIELSSEALQPTTENTLLTVQTLADYNALSGGPSEALSISPSNGPSDTLSRVPGDCPTSVSNDAIQEPEQNPNTTFSPLNNLIQDMAIHTPTNKKRAMSVETASWNKRISRQGSIKYKFNPRELHQAEIIELDD